MKFKKATTGFLAVTILSVSAVTAFAGNTQDLKAINDIKKMEEIMPISTNIDMVRQDRMDSVTGKVTEIRDFEGVKGSRIILLENEEGIVANIIVSNDTYVVNSAEIVVGSVVTGFYDGNAPMIMIYPAQYNTEVVVVNNEDENIKVDIFNKDLVSADNTLKLNISDDTEIVLQDGKPFNGELANRKLVVTYDISTRSIPAQTTPSKIVVLFEKAEHPNYDVTEEGKQDINIDVSNMDIIVNDKKIEAPAAYTNKEGIVMVPLRAIAEALEFDVNWNGESQSVMVGKGISLKIAEDNYIYMKTSPIRLGAAPELVEGKTFVPLSFFKKVAHMNNAYVFEAQIVIDNGEIME